MNYTMKISMVYSCIVLEGYAVFNWLHSCSTAVVYGEQTTHTVSTCIIHQHTPIKPLGTNYIYHWHDMLVARGSRALINKWGFSVLLQDTLTRIYTDLLLNQTCDLPGNSAATNCHGYKRDNAPITVSNIINIIDHSGAHLHLSCYWFVIINTFLVYAAFLMQIIMPFAFFVFVLWASISRSPTVLAVLRKRKWQKQTLVVYHMSAP